MTTCESQLLRAAAFAADKHRHQRRKNKEASPYINHPLQVADLLAGEGGVSNLELLMAAVLHDTVEDTDTTLEEIERLFGVTVAELVAEVTDDKSLPKEQRKRLQVETAASKSDLAKQLKLADKISNIREIDDDNPAGWDRQRKLEYVRWGQRVGEHCQGVNPSLDAIFDQVAKDAAARLGSSDSQR